MQNSVFPGEQGTRKGQTPQRARQGFFVLPRGTEKPKPRAHRRKCDSYDRRDQMRELSSLQVDNQTCLPILWAQVSPGELPQDTPLTEKPWPGQRETWWGWTILFWRLLWGLLAAVVKGETGLAENPKDDKDTQQKKAESLEKLLATLAANDPLREDLENQLEQLQAALKAGRQLRAPPPVFVGPDQWSETLTKPVSERTSHLSIGYRLPGSLTRPSRSLKEQSCGCRGVDNWKQWIHGQAVATHRPARRRGLWRTHRLVCFDLEVFL